MNVLLTIRRSLTVEKVPPDDQVVEPQPAEVEATEKVTEAVVGSMVTPYLVTRTNENKSRRGLLISKVLLPLLGK